ncbi:MAG: CPBP family intramembrane metalloprotease [Clostridiaceae bacterium]|nr:CPBP family intramembrane metalloprotease [Clostridiaceae bacterium]
MKNFLKGTGAAIGYFLLYFVINILVIFIGSVYLGIKESLKVIDDPSLSTSFPQMIESLIYDNALLFSIIAAVICLFVFWMIILATKTSIKERLDLYPISFKNIWPVMILGITANIFISNFISLLPIPEAIMQEYSEATNLLGDEITIVQLLSVVIVAPILEEILYRGLIMKSLQRGMPVIIALLIQAVLFGLMHGQLVWICYATFLGILLAVIKLKYKSLYPSILLHLAFNTANYILIPLYIIMPDSIIFDILLIIISFIISVFMVRIIFRKTIDIPVACNIDPDNSSQYADEGTIKVHFDN